MSDYASTLRALNDAIIHAQKEAALTLVKPEREGDFSTRARLDVYADGYAIRLIDAVTADYPATMHYMGAEAFANAAALYVQRTPSAQWDLNLYSIGFAAQLEDAAGALASVESAIAECFWLAESGALPPSALADISPENLAEKTLCLRKASRLLKLDYAANAYLSAFRAEVPAVMEKQMEFLCVVRHRNEVQRHVLDAAEYGLLRALQDGLCFGEALEKIAGETDAGWLAEKLPGYMERWLTDGFFAAN